MFIPFVKHFRAEKIELEIVLRVSWHWDSVLL